MMRPGYNTNGLAHHRLLDSIDLLADEGYESIAITLDNGCLDPYQDPSTLAREVRQVRTALDRRGLACVVESGARYLLNPRLKHDPTLLDPDPGRRAIRQDFLGRAIDIARDLGGECVSLWSGPALTSVSRSAGIDLLHEALLPVLEHAENAQIALAFEPEPGMFIDTLASFRELDERVRHPLFQLTVDLGHVHCNQEGKWQPLLAPWRGRVINVHIEDMREGVHDHLMFGEGTMDFPAIFRALRSIGYDRGLHVELSRHSHVAVEAVQSSIAFLRPFLDARDH